MMTNRLDNIALRQVASRLREKLFLAAVAAITVLTVGTIAIG